VVLFEVMLLVSSSFFSGVIVVVFFVNGQIMMFSKVFQTQKGGGVGGWMGLYYM
jgi:hypothetical protein